MKKLIITLLFLLLSCPVFAENQQLAWMGTMIVGCNSATCNPENNEVGQRTLHTGFSTMPENYMTCQLFEADCTGTLGEVHIAHDGYGTDNVKIGVFNSVYQTDLTTSHLPDNSDSQVSGSQWVEITDCTGEGNWCSSGATKIGGSVTSGQKYFVCTIADSTVFGFRRVTTGSLINYQIQNGTWGSYVSPPTTLDGGDKTWNSYASRDISIYVEIE